MERKKKAFDCVEMKRKGAEAILRATAGMSREEELAYWARGTADLLKLQKRLREASANATTAHGRVS